MVLGLTLLGGFEARLDSGQPVKLSAKKSQALLAYLACHPGQPQQRDKLAALLWGEASDQRARHSLRQALLALRQALSGTAPPCLVEAGEAVTLNASAVEVDVAVFEHPRPGHRLVVLERAEEGAKGLVALLRGIKS